MAIKFPGSNNCGILTTCVGPQSTAVGPPVQSGFNQSSGAGGITSIAFTMVSSVTAGNPIVVFVQAAAVPTSVPTDTLGNTYSLYEPKVNGSFGMWAYATTASVGSGSNTVTVSLTSQSTVATIVVAEYPLGVQVGMMFDINVNAAIGTTTASTVNLGSQYYAERVIVCAIGNSLTTSSAAGSGFTGRITASGTFAAVLLEDQYLTAPTLVTCGASNIGATVSGVWTTIALGLIARTGPPSVNFCMTGWVKYDVNTPESEYIQVCFNNIANVIGGQTQVGWTPVIANDVSNHMLTGFPVGNGSVTYNTAVVLNQWTFFYIAYVNLGEFHARVLNFGSSSLLATDNIGPYNAPQMPSDIICFGNELSVDNGQAAPDGTSLPIMSNANAATTLAIAYPKMWSSASRSVQLTDQQILAEARCEFPVYTQDLFAWWRFTSPDGTNVDWSVLEGAAAGMNMIVFQSGGGGIFVPDPILPSPLKARALPLGI